MAQVHITKVQFSADGSNWTTIIEVPSSSEGVFIDQMHWLPPYPGHFYFRIVPNDGNGLAVGRTSILAMAANR